MAIGLPPGPEVMMGVSRMVMAVDRSTAEFAVIVADPWQGKGLGEKLIERVIEIARDNGVKMLYGEVLATNLPMLGLMKKTGFSIKAFDDGIGAWRCPWSWIKVCSYLLPFPAFCPPPNTCGAFAMEIISLFSSRIITFQYAMHINYFLSKSDKLLSWQDMRGQ